MSMSSISLLSSEACLSDCLLKIVNEINALDKTIYSYSGNETHVPIYYEEIDLFKKMLIKIGIKCPVIEVSDAEFSPVAWDPKHSVLYIPGAKSSDLELHLGSKVNEIKHFIHNGGRFIGWCGGGYWACHEVQYRLSETCMLHKVRNLDLWKGIEKGPLIPLSNHFIGGKEYAHEVVKVKWLGSDVLKELMPDGIEVNVLLSGGGSFIPAEDEHKYKVLATYQDIEQEKSIAGVKTYVGEGLAVLINPYFTYEADYLKNGLETYKKHFPEHNWSKIISDLEGQEIKSQLCFADMLLEVMKSL